MSPHRAKMRGLSWWPREEAYFVAPWGNNAWPGTFEQPWLTITYANTKLVAGDTCYVRVGTYVNQPIYPNNSGGPGSPITYQAYQNEVVTLNVNSGASIIVLLNRDYIHVGRLVIEANLTSDWVYMQNTDYCLLHNNIMRNAISDRRSVDMRDSTYNILRGNDFSVKGTSAAGFGLPMLDVRGTSHHNLVEDNDFNNANYSLVTLDDTVSYNVMRRNRLQNLWYRDMAVQNANRNLIEANRFGETHNVLPEYPTLRAQGMQLSGSYNIIRQNLFHDCEDAGLEWLAYAGSTDAEYNRIYNNVMYLCAGAGLALVNPTPSIWTTGNNAFKHNILFKNTFGANPYAIDFNYGEAYAGLEDNIFFYNDIIYLAPGADVIHHNLGALGAHTLAWWETNYPANFANNLEADPVFVNEATRDFHLQAGSPMIDAGSALTTANGAGTGSTSLTVVDAGYFCDGWGIVSADYIQIGATEPVQISSINYATNVITLAAARTWSDGAPVYLHTNSLGTVVLRANIPDIGAYEFL